MKKIILVSLLFLQLIAFSAIPGVSDWGTYPDAVSASEKGQNIEVTSSCEHWTEMVYINFEDQGVYYELAHGVYSTEEGKLSVNMHKGGGPENSQMTIGTNFTFLELNPEEDYIEIYSESGGLVCRLTLFSANPKIKDFTVSSSKLSDDTLTLCSEIEIDEFQFTATADSSDEYTFTKNVFFNGTVNLNGLAYTSDKMKELNYKNGDTISFEFNPSYIYLDNNVCLENSSVTSSPSYIVKVVESPVVDILQFDEETTLFCPGGSTVFHKKNLSDNSNFGWYKGTYNDGAEYSDADSIIISTPNSFFLAEKAPFNNTCPEISAVQEIIPANGCNILVYGFLQDNNSYNPTTFQRDAIPGVLVKDFFGNATTTDENGYYEFRIDSAAANYYVSVADNKYFMSNYTMNLAFNYRDSNKLNVRTWLLKEKDLAVSVQSGRNRPGFTIAQYVWVDGLGTDTLTTSVTLELDSKLSYVSNLNEISPSSITNNTITWNNITVVPGERKLFTIYANLEIATPLETVLNNVGYLTQNIADETPQNDTSKYEPVVTGSFDPNDKMAVYFGGNESDNIHDTTSLEYTIRFQNTGTDTAFTVVITDVISASLDLSSLVTLDASNTYSTKIQGDTVTWTFNNVLLPDSNTNEPASHGYVRFSINQKIDNPKGTLIKNKASIYFDFNSPIITNEVITTVNNDFELITSVNEFTENSISTFPNPVSNLLYFENLDQGSVIIYNGIGQAVMKSPVKNALNVTSLSHGLYFFEVSKNNEVYRGKFIKK